VAFTDGREAVYGFDQLDELAHAFAMTVHKSQGSEFPVVIMPLIGGSPLFLNRKLLYTGVTRAKRMMILVGRPEHFIRMIQSDDSRKRKTGLVFRIARYRNLSL
jgi:exodeoxyribonuclease V alpha subunit